MGDFHLDLLYHKIPGDATTESATFCQSMCKLADGLALRFLWDCDMIFTSIIVGVAR